MIWKQKKQKNIKIMKQRHGHSVRTHTHTRSTVYTQRSRLGRLGRRTIEDRTPLRTGKREKSNWMRRKILKLLVSNCNNFHYYCFFFHFWFLIWWTSAFVAHVFSVPQIHVSGEQAWTLNTSERWTSMWFFDGCRRHEWKTQFQIHWPFAVREQLSDESRDANAVVDYYPELAEILAAVLKLRMCAGTCRIDVVVAVIIIS